MRQETLEIRNHLVYINYSDYFTTRIRLQNNNWLFKRYHALWKDLDLFQNGLVLDIGANYGASCLEFMHLGLGNNFVLFEPIEENVQCMTQTFAGHDNIKIHDLAISDSCGTASFNFNPQKTGTSGLDPNGKRLVKTQTLDSFNFQNVHFIKIDVEGAELFVLRGALETIKQNLCPVFFEADPKNIEQLDRLNLCLKFLNDLGYVVINSSQHIIRQIELIDTINLASSSFVEPITDLLAVPPSLQSKLMTKECNVESWLQGMRTKLLGKKSPDLVEQGIAWLRLDKGVEYDEIFTAYNSKKARHHNSSIFEVGKSNTKKIYLLQGQQLYWSYKIFLKNPTEQEIGVLEL